MPDAPFIETRHHVTLKLSHVAALRILLKVQLERYIRGCLDDAIPGSNTVYVSCINQAFDRYRTVDDVLRTGISLMEQSKVMVWEFYFSPELMSFFIEMTEERWVPEDFMLYGSSEEERQEVMQTVGSLVDELPLTLRAAGVGPIKPNMNAPIVAC
jgi:hypothetical protein